MTKYKMWENVYVKWAWARYEVIEVLQSHNQTRYWLWTHWGTDIISCDEFMLTNKPTLIWFKDRDENK